MPTLGEVGNPVGGVGIGEEEESRWGEGVSIRRPEDLSLSGDEYITLCSPSPSGFGKSNSPSYWPLSMSLASPIGTDPWA